MLWNGDGVSEEDAAFQAISAALQLFDLCSPAEDSTISGVDLESALHSLARHEDDVSRIRSLLNEQACNADRYNFLSYWQAVDHFFEEAGAFPKHSGAGEIISTIQGMRKFRDGVLEIHAKDRTQESVPATLLLGLLHEIRANAEDSAYWDEVIQAIPDEEGFGLTMPEVAEAVYIWLKDFTRGDADVVNQPSDLDHESEESTPAQAAPLDRTYTELVDDASRASRAASRMGKMFTELADDAPRETFAPPRRRGLQKQLTLNLQPDGNAGLTLNMQRATELTDLIGQRTPPDLEVVHEAVERLVKLHKIFEKAIQDSQDEASALQKNLDALAEKKEAMERDFSESLQHEADLDQRFESVERQRDENLLRATSLETQVKDLIEHRDLLNAELRKYKADTESYQREKLEVQRKAMMLQSRMQHLENNADTAEGQVSWMRCEVKKLRQQLVVSKQAVRSYAGCYQEAEEVAGLLEKQVLKGADQESAEAKGPAALPCSQASDNSAAMKQDLEELEKQLGLQQVQLQRLRQVRDDLLKAHDSCFAKADDGSCSPRELQIHRRCSFMGAQLHALLQHARELEGLLDDRSKEPDAKRLMSVQRFKDESEKEFGELAENLQTLEVQKEAAESELRRLQTRVAEQENQLHAVQKQRDQLLQESCSQKGAADETRSTVSSSSATSVTRASGADPTFLFGSAASAKPAEGQLRASPKAPESIEKGVKTLIHVQHFGNQQWQRSATSGSRSRKHESNTYAAPTGGVNSQSSAFDFSALSSSENRERSEHRGSRHRDRSSTTKDEKAARREKRDRRHKEADMFTRGYKEKEKDKQADGTCDQQ